MVFWGDVAERSTHRGDWLQACIVGFGTVQTFTVQSFIEP